MYYVTNLNQDGSVSVKVPETNSTQHFTHAQLENMQIPILGVYRNPQTFAIEQIQPVEADDVSQGLLRVINMIETPEVREFANVARRAIPAYFFTEPASTTGKYHPTSNLGYGGLLRHTIYVCENIKHITDLESTRQLFELTQYTIDLLIVACMFHDAFKQGFDHNIKDFSQHPNIAAAVIRGMVGLFDAESLEFIAQCIETHMGEWNTDRQGNIVTRKPSNVYEWMVHLADYMASRPNKTLVLDNTVYVRETDQVKIIKEDGRRQHVITQKDAVSEDDLALVQLVSQSNMVIPEALKKQCGIARTDAEIYDIWNSIMNQGSASMKQKKYVNLARIIVNGN